MDVDLDDLFDSLDSKDDWTKRGILKLVIMARAFKGNVNAIDLIIEKIRWRISMYTLVGVLFSTFATASNAVSMIKDFAEINLISDRKVQVVRLILIAVGFLFTVLTTMLFAYLKVKSFEQELQGMFECSTGYLRLVNMINGELCKKARFRCSMADLFKNVLGDYERLQKFQVSLNMENKIHDISVEMDESERQLTADVIKKRLSTDVSYALNSASSEDSSSTK